MPLKKKDNLMKKEQRCINISATVEKRSNGALGKIFGYAAVFDSDSENMGFIERIAPGAFKKAIKKSDIRGLKNHNPDLIFARQGRNLKIKEDEKGLYYEATPVDTRNYRDTAEEIASGLLTGQSFGFTIEEEEWDDLDKPTPKRTIKKVREIFDVGPVVYPAYNDTSVALRSLEAARSGIVQKPEYTLVPKISSLLKLRHEKPIDELMAETIEKSKQLIDILQARENTPMSDNSNPVEPEPDSPMADTESIDDNPADTPAEPIAGDAEPPTKSELREIEEEFDALKRRYN